MRRVNATPFYAKLAAKLAYALPTVAKRGRSLYSWTVLKATNRIIVVLFVKSL